MGLADFQIARETVSFPGGSFEVRGFSLDDVTLILRDDLSGVNDMLSLYSENLPKNVAVDATVAFIVQMITKAPDLTARIIAQAADEPTLVDRARMLPIPIQLDAVKKVLHLTFDEFGGPKKFLATAQSLGAMLTPRASNLPPSGSPT